MSQLELIFVHGTWSDGEDFSAPTSPFVDTIVRSLGPDVVVSRFCWSGRNRVAAREQAAREFAEFARARAQLPPERLRIAICHSHGGSVVLQSFVQALEDTNPREAPPPIHGIVCIGTPFIHVARLTEAEPDADEPLSPGWYAIGGLIVWQWQRIYDVMCSIGQSMAMHPVLWAFGLVLTAVLAYAPMVLVFMFWAAKNRAFSLSDPSKEEDEFVYGPDDVVERLRNSCRLPLSEPVPTLIVKVPGDEAHAGLAAVQLAALVVYRIYCFPARVCKRLSRTTRLHVNQTISPIRIMTWTGANVVVSILARIAHLTAWLTLSLPFVLLTVACYLLFGYELALRGGRIVLAAGDTPPGSWRVVYVPPLHRYDLRQDRAAAYFDTNYTPGWDDPDDPEEHQRNADAVWAYERTLQEEWRLSTKGLIHSRAYSDPRVARLIVDWVRQHVGTC